MSTSASTFPFTALVGLDALKLALQLATIDVRLSVLARGDKGAGKTTAARGLVDLIAADAPFVNLPIGATEDRLLGGLDVQKAMAGQPALKPGLLADADGGVLYIDEVNLLPDHLADALLDAVASGTHIVEREGFSVTQSARFVLIGSMNQEEGALRPQLLDRFAFAVDVTAPMDPTVRGDVIARRLAYDADPAAFVASCREDQQRLAAQLQSARARLLDVTISRPTLDLIAHRIATHGVRSLRADLATVRGSRALAALEGAPAVNAHHIDTMLPLVLSHRATPLGRPNPSSYTAPSRPDSNDPPSPDRPGPAPTPTRATDGPDASGTSGAETHDSRAGSEADTADTGPAPGPNARPDRVFAPLPAPAPRIIIAGNDVPASSRAVIGASRGSEAAQEPARGVTIGARRTAEPRELDARATLTHAMTHAPARAPRAAATDRTTEMPVRTEVAAGADGEPNQLHARPAPTHAMTHAPTRVAPVAGAEATTAMSVRTQAAAGADAEREHACAAVAVTVDDLHERVRVPRVGVRYVFVVDSSGSHAAHDRMRIVKGAVNGLLEHTHRRDDDVVIVSCRGAAAEVVVGPTSSREEAQRALEYLPTGGRTPLAHALELAAGYVTSGGATIVIILTDGHANVPTRSDDAWADTLEAARAMRCPVLIVDSEDTRRATGRPAQLAAAMQATHLRLEQLDQLSIVRVIQNLASR